MKRELTPETILELGDALLREELSLLRAEEAFHWYGQLVRKNLTSRHLISALDVVEKYVTRLESAGIEARPDLHRLPGATAKFATEISDAVSDEPEFQIRIAEAWIQCMNLFPRKDEPIRNAVARYIRTNSENYFLKTAANVVLLP